MAPEPLKIGYLIPQFPGQTHIFFWREIQALEARGVDVSVFSTRHPPPGLVSHTWSEEAIARTIYLGAVRPMAALSILGLKPKWEILAALKQGGVAFAKDLLICAAAAKHLLNECRDREISHLHVHSCGRAALIAALAQRMGGVPYSLTLHGPLSDYGCGQSFKWRNASFATVITKKLVNEFPAQMRSDVPARLIVQPMGVDTEDFRRDAPYQPYSGAGPLRIFCCARLNIVKGHQDLMMSVRLLVDQGMDVRLEIAGEDDDGGSGYRTVLEDLRISLGLTQNVTFLGAISAEEVKKKLNNADIFVLASWHEPLGVAYMEAMSVGVPTIATNSGGVPELIEDRVNGVMVPPKDPKALADAIRTLAYDTNLATRLSTSGRTHIVENFRSELGAETLAREIRAAKDRA